MGKIRKRQAAKRASSRAAEPVQEFESVSGRYTKAGQVPRWACVQVETQDSAARRALPPAPEGWELEAIARGDHSQESEPLDAPDALEPEL